MCSAAPFAGKALQCVLTARNLGTVRLSHLTSNNAGCTTLQNLAPGEHVNCSVSLVANQSVFDAWGMGPDLRTLINQAPFSLSAAVNASAPATTVSDVAHVNVFLVSQPATEMTAVNLTVSDSEPIAGGADAHFCGTSDGLGLM